MKISTMLPAEALEICRMCLMKERVEVNIFENNTKEILYKISTCLPVTITLDDKLPKKICVTCFDKVNSFYEFWNQSLDSEKHLLSWLSCETEVTNLCDTNFVHSSLVNSGKVVKTISDCQNSNDHNTKINLNNKNDSRLSGLRLAHFLIQSQDNSENNLLENNNSDDNVETDDTSITDDKKFEISDEKNDLESNQILNVSYREEKPGPSGFQEDSSSALKQLQGYTDELTNNSLSNLSKIFQVLNSPGEIIDATALSSASETALYDKREQADLESSYRCDICAKSFSCEDILAMHKLSQCNKTHSIQKCNLCNETFEDSFKLSNHMQSQHDNRKFQCEECSKCFLTKHHLRMHSSMHSDSKPFSCQKCGTTFRYKKTYETHVKIHANEKTLLDEQTFVCDVCEQRFSTRNLYIHHARSHKNVTNKCKLMCFVCNQTFSSKRMLAQHLRTQCGERTYTCDVCKKKLLTKESLECHKLIHVDEKALVCKICGKTFSHRKYFVVHQRIHTGERPYKCVTCNKTFTQASTLTVHRRYHTGERPYKCFICSKGFVTRTIMLSHLKYHKES